MSLYEVIGSWWLGSSICFIAGVMVGFLARRSPKSDWEFIKKGALLWGLFVGCVFIPMIQGYADFNSEADLLRREFVEACLSEEDSCPEDVESYVPEGTDLTDMLRFVAVNWLWDLINIPVEGMGVLVGGVLAGRPKVHVIHSFGKNSQP